MESLSEKLYDLLAKIPKSFYLPIALAICGLILLSIGMIQLGSAKTVRENSQNAAVITQEVQAASTSAGTFGFHVDVEGAVVSPGVYVLPSSGRVQDALVAAGGLSGVADRDFVAKNLNLAAKLADGAKIYIPKVGEVQQGSSTTANTYAGAQVHLMDLNTASSDELDSLPGIGPATAQKIISGRPYQSVDDLLAKKIISSSVFQKIKDLVSVF